MVLPQIESLRAGLYGRASSDPKKRGRSVADQMTDNRKVCGDRNWTIVGEYIDLDRSASRHATKVREHYERLLVDIEAGEMDVVVAWEASRLQRDLRAYGRLREACEKAGVLWCCNGTVYDMRKGSDRTVSAILAAIAESEADSIKDRNSRTTRLNAERGGPHGRIPFGYMRRYDELTGDLAGQFPHPERAEVVRSLFERAAACEALSELANSLSGHVPGATVAGVRYLLKNRAYIGLRTSKGADAKAQWDGIVEPGVFWRVQEVLGAPERRHSRDTRAVYLQSGIAECGVCEPSDARRGVKGVPSGYHSEPRYSCRAFGHVSVGVERLDAYVEHALLTWLRSPAAASAFAPPQAGEILEAQAKLAALRAQLGEARELASAFDPVTYAPRLSAASLGALESRLLPLIVGLEERVRKLSAAGDPVVGKLLGASAEHVQLVWDDLRIEQRRHALRSFVRVTLMHAHAAGDPHLGADRVRIVFVGQPGFQAQGRRTRGLAAAMAADA